MLQTLLGEKKKKTTTKNLAVEKEAAGLPRLLRAHAYD